MRPTLGPMLILAATLCVTACGRKSAPPTAGSATPITSQSARTPAATGPDAKMGRRAQGKCPNWVPGAKTQSHDVEGGVALTITAEPQAAVGQIRERSEYLALGKSKGGDATGRCPVIRSAKIEWSEIAGGARVVLRPTEKLPLDELQRQVRARLKQTAQ